MRRTFVIIIGMVGLMGSVWGQAPSTNTTKKLKLGLSLAAGAHREFLMGSAIESPNRPLTYIQYLNWGWRVQVGVVGDYGIGMSRFGIRMGLAVGLRRVDFGWLGVLTNPLDSASIPVFLRFDKDQLELLADMKLALRYQGQSKQPWVAQAGAFFECLHRAFGTDIGHKHECIRTTRGWGGWRNCIGGFRSGIQAISDTGWHSGTLH